MDPNIRIISYAEKQHFRKRLLRMRFIGLAELGIDIVSLMGVLLAVTFGIIVALQPEMLCETLVIDINDFCSGIIFATCVLTVLLAVLMMFRVLACLMMLIATADIMLQHQTIRYINIWTVATIWLTTFECFTLIFVFGWAYMGLVLLAIRIYNVFEVFSFMEDLLRLN